MYKKHPYLIEPENLNQKIWRYMDFTKFISLLLRKSLFFCRVDKLGDQNEMSLPLANRKKNIEFFNRNKEIIEKSFKGKLTLELWNNILDFTRRSIIINSWNCSDYESAAMWSTYLRTNQGIAIQSSFNRLCESFNKTNYSIHIGLINYKDYKHDLIQENTIFGYVSHKLKSYEHEKELRAIITNQVDEKLYPLHETGKYIPINLEVLIESIYIAPNAPRWFNELVVDIMKKFNLDIPIKTSELNDRSLY